MFGIKKSIEEKPEFGFKFYGTCQVVKKSDLAGATLVKVRTTNLNEIGSELTMNIPDKVLDKIIINFDYLTVEGHFEDRTTKSLNVKSYMFVDKIIEHRRKDEKVAI